MQKNIALNKPHPQQNANILSKLTFTWFVKLCRKSVRRNLEIDDLYKNLPTDQSNRLTDKLERNWNREIINAALKYRNPNLLRVIRRTFFWTYFFYGLFLFLHTGILKSIQPILLATFIGLFSESDGGNESSLEAMSLYGGSILLVTFFVIIIEHHTNLMLGRIGMRLRIACSSLVYRKALRLSQKAIEQTAAGEIINLLSNDVNRFDSVAIYLHHIWIMPILLAITCFFVWQQVQVSGLIGMLTLFVLTIPVHLFVGKLKSKLRLKVAKKTDERINKMSEIVSGIQVIKMYAWEKPFALMVDSIRAQEINTLTKVSYLRGVVYCSAVFLERLTLFLTLVIYILLGNTPTAAQVFSVAQFINLAQLSMAIFLPHAISLGAESLISVKRLQEFLLLEEKFLPMIGRDTSKEVVMKNVQASWVPTRPILQGITLKIPSGCLCAVVGPVGVGKSSILQLLLGELVQERGSIRIGGKISYAAQKPWLFASTVRQNILFGEEYDRELYRNTVRACALKRDLQQLAMGDQTLVGDNGVALSGGQKARINLARAIYRKADIYLLDDPLSAVDTHVGKELFRKCIKNLLDGKTRILITHQLQYLKEVDYVIVINAGKIEAQGTFAELSKLNMDFTKLLVAPEVEKDIPAANLHNESFLASASLPSCRMESLNKEDVEGKNEVVSKSGASALWQYLKFAQNAFLVGSAASFVIVGQAAANCSDIWVTLWTSEEISPNGTQVDFLQVSTETAISVYASLIIVCIILFVTGAILCYKVAMMSSKNLHNKMFSSLLEAPMRFFDINPSGRILNRFSRDMGIIDDILPPLVYAAIQVMLVMIGILCLVIFTNPYLSIVIIVLALIFKKIQNWYNTVARDIKHFEGITKSPVFSHISSTWNGIVTIRASEMESQLKAEFDSHQDTHTSPWHLSLIVMAAFGIWMDFLSLLFITCVIFGFILMAQYKVVSGSYVGLAVFQSSILTGMVQYGISQIAQAVSQITSVERVLEYTKLKTEATECLVAPTLWPTMGEIQFVDVFLRYSQVELPVLKNLNCIVKPGEKIGIVGRTGAGKSSLISAIFRLAPIEGSVIIDGTDTKEIALADLRSNISIIPQEPVLFSETLRYNLDPLKRFSDEAIWKALEEVELKNVATTLDYFVHEGGSNFSVGQRQLICLARALLRRNKILVLDEATANVDAKTDELIQETIRSKFKDCTVLTIAHRLNTIMDSDKVMVMDDGFIVEYDHAYRLLQNQNGCLYKMVAEADSVQLMSMAEVSYNAIRRQ